MTKTIVITGSTKGIGYGLAEEFLKFLIQTILDESRSDLEFFDNFSCCHKRIGLHDCSQLFVVNF